MKERWEEIQEGHLGMDYRTAIGGGLGLAGVARCAPGSERVTWGWSRPVISFTYLTGADPEHGVSTKHWDESHFPWVESNN